MKFSTFILLTASASALTLRRAFPADEKDANPKYPKDVHEMTPLTAHDNHTWGPPDTNKPSYPIV